MIAPECHIVSGDYALFSLFSQRMYAILRRFTPDIEEYSIDEAFAHVGNSNLHALATRIRDTVQHELGIPVSVGIAPTKCLAKLASEHKKPRGVTIVGTNYTSLLYATSIGDVWGIGRATQKKLALYGVQNALDFARLSPALIRQFTKPHRQLWKELNGISVMYLDTRQKSTYHSMMSSRTFAPSSSFSFLWAQMREHIETTFARARAYKYAVKELVLMLKTQSFTYSSIAYRFPAPQEYPLAVIGELKNTFGQLYKPHTLYRKTGCTLTSLVSPRQLPLFTSSDEKIASVYKAMKGVHFGTSLFSNHTKAPQRFSLPLLSLSDVESTHLGSV